MREGREEKRTPVGRALGKIKDRERKTGSGGGDLQLMKLQERRENEGMVSVV